MYPADHFCVGLVGGFSNLRPNPPAPVSSMAGAAIAAVGTDLNSRTSARIPHLDVGCSTDLNTVLGPIY